MVCVASPPDTLGDAMQVRQEHVDAAAAPRAHDMMLPRRATFTSLPPRAHYAAETYPRLGLYRVLPFAHVIHKREQLPRTCGTV